MYFIRFVICPVILLINFCPSLVTSKCIGSEWEQPYSKECLEFCDSRHEAGHTEKFHVDCENPFPGDPGPIQDTCRWTCAEKECPCYSCPTGNYVVCPAISKSSERKVRERKNGSQSGSSEDDGPPITEIAIGVTCALLGFIILGVLGGWLYWHFTKKREQGLAN